MSSSSRGRTTAPARRAASSCEIAPRRGRLGAASAAAVSQPVRRAPRWSGARRGRLSGLDMQPLAVSCYHKSA